MKAIRRFSVRPVLPTRIAALGDLAMNLRWSWHPPLQDLFESIDPARWAAVGEDPVAMLSAVEPVELERLAADSAFVERVDTAKAALDRYLDDQRTSLGGALDRIRAVLEDPASLRLSSPPVTSAVEVPVVEAAVVAPEPEPEPTPVAVDEPDPELDPDPEVVRETIVAVEDIGGDDDDEPAADLFGGSGAPTPAAGPPTAQVAVFDAEAEEAEERYLDNGGDEESDEAMRRFFEADFDDDQRFGR